MFPGHVVSLRDDIWWPPRSPDVFLWVKLESEVFQNNPRNLGAHKEAITNEVAAIEPDITHRVIETFQQRRSLHVIYWIVMIHWIYECMDNVLSKTRQL